MTSPSPIPVRERLSDAATELDLFCVFAAGFVWAVALPLAALAHPVRPDIAAVLLNVGMGALLVWALAGLAFGLVLALAVGGAR